MPPLVRVVDVVVKKAQETIVSSRDIDGLDEVGGNLADFFDVVVGWGVCDGGELGIGVGKERFCFLGRSYCSRERWR